MILVVGGLASGKRDWVLAHLGYTPEQMSDSPYSEAPVLYDLQDFAPLWEQEQLLPFLLSREVLICNEVGCGVVPISEEERERRERVGRLCVLLAQRADTVVRVFCGIGTVIKGTLP